MANKKQKQPEMAFEEAMEKLESIVEEMESEKLPLEELITGYEQGTKLLKVCQSRIADAQKRIEIIAREAGEENFDLKDFDPDGEAEEDAETAEEEESDEVRLL